MVKLLKKKELRNEELENIRQVFLRNSQVILKSLDNLRGVYDDDLIDFFIDGRLDLAHKFEKANLLIRILFIRRQTMSKTYY